MKPDGDDAAARALRRALRRQREWWVIGGVAALAVGFLVAAGIVGSHGWPSYDVLILGNRRLRPGTRAAFRIAAYVGTRKDYAPQVAARLDLLALSGKRTAIGSGSSHGHGTVDLNAWIPASLDPGCYRLEAHVTTPAGRPRTVRVPVGLISEEPLLAPTVSPACQACDLESNGPWLRRRNPCEEGGRWGVGMIGPDVDVPYWPQPPPLRAIRDWPSPLCGRRNPLVHLYPEDGYLANELRNRIIAWFPGGSGGATWQALGYRSVPGRPRAPAPKAPAGMSLDALGLAAFDYVPHYRRGALRFMAHGKSETLWLRSLPSPLRLHSARVLLVPGARVPVVASLLQREARVHFDLWIDGQWTTTTAAQATDGSCRYTLEIPPAARGLIALRAYHGAAGPVFGATDQVLFVSPDGDDPAGLRHLAREVASLPATAPLALFEKPPGADPLLAAVARARPETLAALGPDGREMVASAILSRVEVMPWAAPRLEATRVDWDLGPQRPSLPSDCPPAVASALLAVAVVLGLLIKVMEDHRPASLPAAGNDAPTPEDPLALDTKSEAILHGIMLLIVVASAFAGLVTLLESLRW